MAQQGLEAAELSPAWRQKPLANLTEHYVTRRDGGADTSLAEQRTARNSLPQEEKRLRLLVGLSSLNSSLYNPGLLDSRCLYALEL